MQSMCEGKLEKVRRCVRVLRKAERGWRVCMTGEERTLEAVKGERTRMGKGGVEYV